MEGKNIKGFVEESLDRKDLKYNRKKKT